SASPRHTLGHQLLRTRRRHTARPGGGIFMVRMAIRRILQLGDPLLRTISTPATASEAAPIFADLPDTLHEFHLTHGFGRGISAVQIGQPKRLIYIELDGRAYHLRNPVYEYQSPSTFFLWDDCFSFPDLLVWLERAETVRIRYEDEKGDTLRI